ncbi:hypothetical protein [Bacteriovorax sp. BSW11_IV]|uniref:hypothetical protein n=1 Tax=Bacteriovorax sp. BSW11_IV TaxID=1353529 RepID=UPI000427DEE9|nr:hypothetical protein [Bacteriovorax sp. BSW11_IV]
MIKYLVFIFIALSPAYAKTISVSVFESGDSQFFETAKRGLEFFSLQVKRSCSIDIDFEINRGSIASTHDINFVNETMTVEYEGLQLKYFQPSLVELLKSNNLLNYKRELTLIDVPNLTGHCGFAFPKVQFEQSLPMDFKEQLKDHVLLNLKGGGCGSSSRLIAHELAHIFIQDNPPHMCEDGPCDENNILSVYRYISNFDENQSRGRRHNRYEDPIFRQRVPSVGVDIDTHQCLSILKTLGF